MGDETSHSQRSQHRLVMITYNSVGMRGDGKPFFQNGPHIGPDKRIDLFQSFIRKDKEVSGDSIKEKELAMLDLFDQVRAARIPPGNVNYWVINCGKLPALALGEASKLQVPPEKLVFVHCGCDEGRPAFASPLLVKELGLGKAGWVETDCGGVDKLLGMYYHFMISNEIEIDKRLADVIWIPKKKG
jgi:hypothetical protein